MQARTPIQTIGLLLLATAVLAAALAVAAPRLPNLVDFDQTFYPAIRYLLAGENPYTANYVIAPGLPASDFFSPAWLLPILLPFGVLPQPYARALWGMFLVGCMAVTFLQMRPWGMTGLRPLWLLILPWSLIGLIYGQVTPLVLLGTIWALNIVYVQAEPEQPAANWQHHLLSKSTLQLVFAFLLIGIKPQFGVFIVAPLLLEMAWQRDKRLIGLALVGGLLVGLTAIFTLPWLLNKATDVYAIAPLESSTLEQELTVRNLPLWWAQPVRLLILVVMGWWVWLQKGTSPAWWAAWLTAVLIITPYTRPYDTLLMMPMLGVLFLQRRWQFGIFILLILCFVFLRFSEMGSVIVVTTAWLLFIPWRNLFDKQRPPSFLAGWQPAASR